MKKEAKKLLIYMQSGIVLTDMKIYEIDVKRQVIEKQRFCVIVRIQLLLS